MMKVTLEQTDQNYGGKLYACCDVEGYLCNFGSHDPWVGYNEDGTVWDDFTGTYKDGVKVK
jgi:hypothetical protein